MAKKLPFKALTATAVAAAMGAAAFTPAAVASADTTAFAISEVVVEKDGQLYSIELNTYIQMKGADVEWLLEDGKAITPSFVKSSSDKVFTLNEYVMARGAVEGGDIAKTLELLDVSGEAQEVTYGKVSVGEGGLEITEPTEEDDKSDVELAVEAAISAIDELSTELTLGDSQAVADARVLVTSAIELGASEEEITNLSTLVKAETTLTNLAVKAVQDATTRSSLLEALQNPVLALSGVNADWIRDYQAVINSDVFIRTKAEIQQNVIDAVKTAKSNQTLDDALKAVVAAEDDASDLLAALKAPVLGLTDVQDELANVYQYLYTNTDEDVSDVAGLQEFVIDAAPAELAGAIQAINSASTQTSLLTALKSDVLGLADDVVDGSVEAYAELAFELSIETVADVQFILDVTAAEVLVEATEALVGFGEGEPFEVVTQEDIDTATDSLEDTLEVVEDLRDGSHKTALLDRLAGVEEAIADAEVKLQIQNATAAVDALLLIDDNEAETGLVVALEDADAGDDFEAALKAFELAYSGDEEDEEDLGAVGLVAALEAGSEKEDLEDRLEVIAERVQLAVATNAVAVVKDAPLTDVEEVIDAIELYNTALVKVNSYYDSVERDALLDDLSTVKGAIEDAAQAQVDDVLVVVEDDADTGLVADLEAALADLEADYTAINITAFKDALDAAVLAYAGDTENDVVGVVGLVDDLFAGDVKDSLVDVLAVAGDRIDLVEATFAVLTVEEAENTSPSEVVAAIELLEDAQELVSALPTSDDKEALQDRLDTVKETLDTTYAGFISAVNDAETAEEVKTALEAALELDNAEHTELFLTVYGDTVFTSLDEIEASYKDVVLTGDVNVATDVTTDDALLALEHKAYINLGSANRVEVAELFYTVHNVTPKEATEFTSTVEVAEAIDAAIAQYTGLIAGVNDASTIVEMRAALQAIEDAYETEVGISIEEAEKVIKAKTVKDFPGFKTVAEINAINE